MITFLKQKAPFELGEHQQYKAEEVLFPDPKIFHQAYMGMIFDNDETEDSVRIDVENITMENGDRQSFQLRLTIPGLRVFAKQNN